MKISGEEQKNVISAFAFIARDPGEFRRLFFNLAFFDCWPVVSHHCSFQMAVEHYHP
ncbi:MAG: hypothetical protein K6U04_14430 [Armatimonadetes bacterium]|nr:hypothetical protein [Armatimonadota bacterium]